MNIEQKVIEFIKKQSLLCNASSVAVGVSGGADSVFLLYFLTKYKSNFGINNLLAVHVNHNLRGIESDADEKYVRSLCSEIGVECICTSVDVKQSQMQNKTTLEETARNLRYAEFEKIIKQKQVDVFCLAHHMGDQAETVLMHILRGSGLSGACGMYAKKGVYERPLLCVTKQEIEEYLKQNDILFRLDSSNLDNAYSRNFLRNEIVPKLEQIFPNVQNSLCAFAEKCQSDEKYIVSNLSEDWIKEKNGEIFVSNSVQDLPDSLKNRVLKKAFEQAGAYRDVEQKHIELLCELFKLKAGSVQHFPMNVQAYKDYTGITLKQVKTAENGVDEIEFKVPQKIKINNLCIDVKKTDSVVFEENCYTVDYFKIPNGAVWRTKMPGDVFAKLGSGTKKLADYFTDKKLVLRDRATVPLLCYKNEVLIVAGMDISEKIKIDDTTEKLVKIEFRRK